MNKKYERHTIKTPAGNQFVFCGKDEDKTKSVEQLLDYWDEYCKNNWMSDDHENMWCPEKKVKYFLEGLANVFLYRNASDVVTPDKAVKIYEKEVPLSTLLDSQERLIAYKVQPVIWQHLSFMIG